MTLRSDNPFIEQDLTLIITTFEKKMIKSRDSDSVFVGFRRDLETMANIPSSVITVAEKIPSASTTEVGVGRESLTSSMVGSNLTRVPTPEELVDNSSSGDTEGKDEEWKEELKKLGEECLPCDFRTSFEADVDFSFDVSGALEDMLNKLKKELPDLEDFLDIADVDLLDKLCALADLFKLQCNADLKKMMFILQQMLQQTEIEMGYDLGFLDTSLSSLLEPIITELMANLDILDSLLLAPIRCILDEIIRQVEEIPRTRDALQQSGSEIASQFSSSARGEAESARTSVQEASRAEQRSQQRPQQVLDDVGEITRRIRQAADMDRLREYLDRGVRFLEEKKDWLLRQLQDLVDRGADQFNRRMNFAKGKTDILDLIAIIAAIIKLADKEEISCGSDAGSATQEDLSNILSVIRHPSSPSDISEEDGIITVRRSDGAVSSRENGVRPSEEGIIRTGSEGTDSQSFDVPGNIVIRRPIASCLKKVTQSEADQVQQWIRQLEQEG